MYCPKCGSQTGDDADFCPKCGNDLRAVKATSADAAATAPMPASASGSAPDAPPAVTDESGQWTWDAASGRWIPTVAATQEATAVMPQADAPDAAATPDGARQAKRGLSGGVVAAIVVGILVLLGVCTGMGFLGWSSFGGGKPASTGSATFGELTGTTDTAGTPETSSPSETRTGASSPDAAVDAWYKAVVAADIAGIKKTATQDFAAQIQPGMFEGRDPATSYRIVASSLPPNGGQVGDTDSVDVQESVSGVDAKSTVTFSVLKTENGWLISGVTETATGVSAVTPPPAATTPAPPTSLSKDQAIDVVGRFLDAQKSGRNAEMKKLATPRYLKDDPTKFVGSAAEAFIQFEVVKAVKKGDTWLVTTKESWISGPENPTYHVVFQGGKGLVDNETYPQ
jgi:hypothetical protein